MKVGDKVRYKRQYLEDAGFELGSALFYLQGTVLDLVTLGKTKCAVVDWDGYKHPVNIDILEKAKDQTGTG